MRTRSFAALAQVGLMILLAQGPTAKAAEIRVLSLPGFKAVMEDLGPEFERTTGHTLVSQFGLPAQLKVPLDADEFDVRIVTESKMLLDRLTGSEREVDICIETSLAGHSLLVGIECRDHGRNADVTWVEQMKCKHERLPTNALVLASRRRFTAEAVRLAAACGIETVFLEEENADVVGRVFGDAGTIWKNFYQARPTKVKVSVLPPGSEDPIVVRCHPSTQLVNAQGQDAGSIDALVANLLRLTPVRAYFETQGKPEHHYFEFKWTLPGKSGLFLRKLKPDRLEQVTLLHVIGTVRFDPATFQMRQARLGANSFLWGVGSAFGDRVVAVASDTPGGPVVALSLIGNEKKRRNRNKASKPKISREPKSKKKPNANRRRSQTSAV